MAAPSATARSTWSRSPASPFEVKLAETGLRLLSGADLYVVDED